jgi:hypothetical protein
MKSAWLQRAGVALALCAVLVTAGSHWLVLQSVAWAGMFVRFAREDPIGTALAKTFDGQHPCPLCRKVQEGRRSEQQEQPMLRLERGPDFAWQRGRIEAPTHPRNREPIPFLNPFHLDQHPAPQTPPPKSLPFVFIGLSWSS